MLHTIKKQRSLKMKDTSKMESYLHHLQAIQKIDRTWNFNYSTIQTALRQVNKDPRNQSIY